MIKSYFRLIKEPFSRDVEIGGLYANQNVQDTVSRMDHVVRKRLFAVLTGDSGVGKTTAIRRLTDKLDKNRYVVLYISDSALTARNFYFEALHQLGIAPRFYRGDTKRQLQRALLELKAEQKTPVVIVDEGHLLDRSMLEEIRFLLNMGMDSYSPLSLILVGQSELKDTLKLQVNSAITQRVDFKCHLSPLEHNETADYIRQHLKVCGASAEIFTQNAVKTIHDYAGGVARKINKLCILSMRAGASQNQQLIDDHLIRDVIAVECDW